MRNAVKHHIFHWTLIKQRLRFSGLNRKTSWSCSPVSYYAIMTILLPFIN